MSEEENEWVAEIRNNIRYQLDSIVKEEIWKLSVDATALEKTIKDLNLYPIIGDSLKSKVANEIGNRLRCYDTHMAGLLDKAFESVWTEQLQRAMEDRVRRKIDNFIDKAIQDKLKGFMT
jgi:hypothetical protein